MNFADSDFLMGKNVSKFFQTCIDKFVDEWKRDVYIYFNFIHLILFYSCIIFLIFFIYIVFTN